MRYECPGCGGTDFEKVERVFSDCTITYWNCTSNFDDEFPCSFSTWNEQEILPDTWPEPDGQRYIGGGRIGSTSR